MIHENMIEIRNLTKTYPNGFTALRNVSFEIGRGEVVGYLGPNGAGKTTTIKILTNLIKPTSGRALVSGIDISRRPKEALGHIGALIEVPGIYGYLTPMEVLKYFGRVHGMDRRRIEERIETVMTLVSLEKWIDSKISGFSTGMQRRFAMAKALLHEPEILILDEPVLGLDPKGIIDIRNMISRLSAGGMTILLSSHLLPEVSETCGRAIFIDRGRIIGIEKVSEILENCRTSVFEIVPAVPPSPELLENIRRMDSVCGISLVGRNLQIGCTGGYEKGHEMLESLIMAGLRIRSFTPVKTDLEDYYLKTVEAAGGVI